VPLNNVLLRRHRGDKVTVACLQVEESYISADSFQEKVGVDVKALLKTEVPLLQGLGFDLVVYSPYRALHGLFQVGQRGGRGGRHAASCRAVTSRAAGPSPAAFEAPALAAGRGRVSTASC
jgi:cyclin H